MVLRLLATRHFLWENDEKWGAGQPGRVADMKCGLYILLVHRCHHIYLHTSNRKKIEEVDEAIAMVRQNLSSLAAGR